MDLGIERRVAMVAAASKGIGLAVATALAKEGCRVSICSRDPEGLEEARRRILEDYALRVQGTIPIGRYGQPREIGEVVAFLASERASYVTGATIQVDGGLIQSTF